MGDDAEESHSRWFKSSSLPCPMCARQKSDDTQRLACKSSAHMANDGMNSLRCDTSLKLVEVPIDTTGRVCLCIYRLSISDQFAKLVAGRGKIYLAWKLGTQLPRWRVRPPPVLATMKLYKLFKKQTHTCTVLMTTYAMRTATNIRPW